MSSVYLLYILADNLCQVFLNLLRYKLRGGDYGIFEGAGANAVPGTGHTGYNMPQQPLDGFSASYQVVYDHIRSHDLVALLPAVVVGYHSHGSVADFRLTCQLCLRQAGHKDNVGSP